MSKVNLFSAVGIDYTALREFLAAKDWLKANDETARLILKIAGKVNEGRRQEAVFETRIYTSF